MNKNLQQINQFLTGWYKTFGVDHIFYKIDSMKSSVLKQEDHMEGFSNLEDLKNAVITIDCPLKKMAKNTVFSDGSPDSDIMIIGEAPGQEEDEQGKPFVGQSGQLLNNMLLSVGIKRSEVYISNVLFWRPPGNRTPSLDEISFCLPYVEQHIVLVNPKVLLLLGGVAVKTILNTSDSISKIRGRIRTYHGINTIATFHPAYLLRSPGQKAVAFRDFILLKRLLLDPVS
jgi:DNA polymerase